MCDDEDTGFLNLAAVCDAIHDFKGKPYGRPLKSDRIIPDVLDGVKCPSVRRIDNRYVTYPEESLIQDYIGYDEMKYLIGDLERSNYNKNIEIFNKPYNVKLLHILRGGSVIKYLERMEGINEKELIDFFASKKVNILYDSGINALKVFSEVNKEELTINQIINRECINDSARKPTSALNTIGQLKDTEQDKIVYDKTSKFNTKYTLALDKLNNDGSNEMDIHFTINDNSKRLYESHHKGRNTGPECAKYLTTYGNGYKKDVIYQVKRSGDWLQGLSCLDIKREYNGKKENLENIILMTFDKIFLIYALFLGLNVLFTNRDNEVIYFKSEIIPRASVPVVAVQPEVIAPVPVAPAPPTGSEFSRENISNLVNIMTEYTTAENRRISEKISNKQLYIRLKQLFETKPKLREQLRKYISKGKPERMNETTYEFTKKALAMEAMEGGKSKSKDLCKKYLIELSNDLESFDSEENPDYHYYEKVAFIILSCLNEYKGSANIYEQMQAIAFDILPSIEGYIKCKEPDIIQFFSGDQYTADCTSYAARNIALHTLELRTGTIESLGNREKYSVKIPSSAVDFYKKIEKHLEKSTFEERRDWLIEQLEVYNKHLKLKGHKRASTRRVSSGIKMSKHKLVTAGGSRKTRKSRK